MVTAGDDAEAVRLAVVVRDLLVRLDLTLDARTASSIDSHGIIERPDTFEPALARAWIDLAPQSHVTLYIVDERWERILVRRVVRDPSNVEVVREELAHIVETAIEAMLAGARIGLERQKLLPPPPETREAPRHRRPPEEQPTKSEPTRFVLRAGIYEHLVGFSTEAPVAHALGLSGSIEAESWLHPGIWLGVDYRWPTWGHTGIVGVKLEAFEARLLGRVSLFSSGAWRVDAAMGPGLDVTMVTSMAETRGVTLARPSADASFVLRGALSVRWNVVGLSATLDVDTMLRDYPVLVNGTQTIALTPFRARPGLMLEATTP